MNTNLKGAIAEAAIAYEAIRLGVGVFRPASEHSRCDLIFEVRTGLYRVQCKTARRTQNVICISLVGSRHTPNGYVRTLYEASEIDLIAAHSHELGRSYLLPFDERLIGRTSIQLRLSPPLNSQRAAIHFASDHEFSGAVAQLGERRRGTAEVRGSSPLSSTPSSAETTTIGAHELRERFGYWMERANAGDEILVTRHGRPFIRLGPVASEVAPIARSGS